MHFTKIYEQINGHPQYANEKSANLLNGLFTHSHNSNILLDKLRNDSLYPVSKIQPGKYNQDNTTKKKQPGKYNQKNTTKKIQLRKYN